MTTSTLPPGPGARIGPFRIEAEIGSGGMGVVYRAHDDRLERDVALKILVPQSTGDAEAHERLMREARTASSLNHPNICTVYEVGESDGRGWIAMELVEGRPLRDMIPQGGMSSGESIRCAVQIADALAHAHKRGVVHRDLKTTNVMVRPSSWEPQRSEVKVLDFGLAKRLADGSAGVPNISLTQTGMVLGTPHYLPPEALLGEKADARGDLWSLGVMLHEMLSGTLPFQGATVMAVCSSILHDDPVPLPDSVSPPLRDLVRRLLAKKPAERIGSATELRRELEILASGPIPSAPFTIQAGRPAPRWRWALAGVAAVILGAVLFFRMDGMHRLGLDLGSTRIRSLAVLPLANLSGDASQDYFANGMTEELITQLAPIEGLKVISRTSVMQYAGTNKTVSQIARELGVDGIVEGSVLRSGERVRITAQLIDGAHDRHLWAESYERDLSDVLGLQREVARDITSKIRLELTPAQTARLHARRAIDPVAYELYLRGRYEWSTVNDHGVRRAIAYFQQAIRRDSTDARPYAGIADSYLMLTQVVGSMTFAEALPKIKQYAERALALDPQSAEAHTSTGVALLWYDRNWAGAEGHMQRAIALNPGFGSARLAYSVLLTLLKRHDAALDESRRSLELDPLSIINNYSYAWNLYYAHRFDDALSQIRKVRELDPNFPPVRALEARIFERTGRYTEAARNTTVGTAWGAGPEQTAMLVQAAAAGGQAGYWRKQLEFAHRGRRDTQRRSYTWIAIIFTGLGERDSAFAALNRADHEREGDVLFAAADPSLDALRSDPRMEAFLDRIGLPR